jgi:two-component system response regulator TctD
MHVLLVEDNRELSAALQVSLMGFGHDVVRVFTLAEARAKVAQEKMDAVVLDLGLPDGDGYEFVRYVRAQRSDLPILILTARSSIEERIIGMKSGADDYLTKPFAVDELMARLEVLVRRLRPEDESHLQLGNVEMDLELGELTVAGRILSLPQREFELLKMLLRKKERVVSKDAIEARLFSEASVGSNAIDVYAHRLRKRIAEAGADIELHTIRGVGFCAKPKAHA